MLLLHQTFTATYTVTEKVYKGFIATFADNNPLHTDAAFAQQYGMPQVVMHGNILNGFVSHFIGEGLPQKNVIIHSQTINYYLPVFLNDTLTLQAEVTEIHQAVNAIMFKFMFRNQAGKRVAKGTVQVGLL